MSYSLVSHSLNPYQSRTLTNNFYIPYDIPTGEYYVGVYADPFNVYNGEFSEYWNNAINIDVGSPNGRLFVKPPSQCP